MHQIDIKIHQNKKMHQNKHQNISETMFSLFPPEIVSKFEVGLRNWEQFVVCCRQNKTKEFTGFKS